MTITIDEIKKLDAARSKGHWSCDLYASVWRVVCEDNTLAEEPESEISYKLLSDGSSEPIDIMLMAAAPQIAAKCLELDEVSRQLLKTLIMVRNKLKTACDLGRLNISDLTCVEHADNVIQQAAVSDELRPIFVSSVLKKGA